uniref:Uncharacterized protein n=1 Tax=Thermofilum pendens TaxID=2269 RepID=A0A7C1NY80_THEPE
MVWKLTLLRLLTSYELAKLRVTKDQALHYRELLRAFTEKLPVLAALAVTALVVKVEAQPSTTLLEKILQPFIDIVAMMAALTFAAGILGFVVLLVDAAVSWITGGSFGRSLAVSKLLRAVETLGVIPLIFFIVNVLGSLGIPEVAEVAKIANSLLTRGWDLILSALGG